MGSSISSRLLEFHRFDDPDSGLLRKGDRYIALVGQNPARQVRMPIHWERFAGWMRALNYRTQTRENRPGQLTPRKAQAELKKAIKSFVPSEVWDGSGGGNLHQIDLVANVAEIAAIPFEAGVSPRDPVVITRRVRGAWQNLAGKLGKPPRLLFAWSAAGGDVPSDGHRAALRKALWPWLPADAEVLGDSFTEIGDASLEKISAECRNQDYTHVHILAHGCSDGAGEHEESFGLALDGSNAFGPELCQALSQRPGGIQVVSVAACDSAKNENMFLSRKSIAHDLHVGGFPVVVASQLPLTKVGSILMTGRLYEGLFRGDDIRRTLHSVRLLLHENRGKTRHDWIALVAYVSLPESYEEHVVDGNLRDQLRVLRDLRQWTERVLRTPEQMAPRLDGVREHIDAVIERLGLTIHDERTKKAQRSEAIGLMASAQKRLAEVLFRVGDLDNMRTALEKSLGWYALGFDEGIGQHWLGVQAMSLQAALHGRIEPRDWMVAMRAADSGAKRDPWALGSMAELRLLAPLAGQQPDLGQARSALAELKAHPKREGAMISSTREQLTRYIEWWTPGRGFKVDLAEEAQQLVALLE